MHSQLRWRLRLVVCLALIVSVVIELDQQAIADGGMGDGWTSGTEIGASASERQGPARRRRATGDSCRYLRVSPSGVPIADQMAARGLVASPAPGAQWYRRMCPDGQVLLVSLVPSAAAAGLAQDALGRAPLPLPDLGLSPGADQAQIVNLQTWLWVTNWAPVTTGAAAASVSVTVTATPVRVDWDMGDGGSVSCGGPGTPYDPARPAHEQHTDCGYTYRTGSAGRPGDRYLVQATSVWQVTWSASGAPGGGDLGFVNRSTTVPVRVAEIQALNR